MTANGSKLRVNRIAACLWDQLHACVHIALSLQVSLLERQCSNYSAPQHTAVFQGGHGHSAAISELEKERKVLLVAQKEEEEKAIKIIRQRKENSGRQ